MGTAARFERVRDRARELAPRAPGYEYALVVFGRDRRFGGGLLAGALAFRLFGALLPVALLIAVLLGYAATVDATAPREIGAATGLGEDLFQSIAESSKLTTGTRWIVALTAVISVLWAATSAARAVRSIHSIAWSGGVERFGKPLRAGVLLLAAMAAFAGVMGAAGQAREELGAAGVLLTLAAGFAFVPIWLAVELLLPHGQAPWLALLPGAVLVAIGIQLVHLTTVLYIADRVERASDTYGPLGVSFTVLFWLYLVSRVMVASAMLNAAVWEHRAAPAKAQPAHAPAQLT